METANITLKVGSEEKRYTIPKSAVYLSKIWTNMLGMDEMYNNKADDQNITVITFISGQHIRFNHNLNIFVLSSIE